VRAEVPPQRKRTWPPLAKPIVRGLLERIGFAIVSTTRAIERNKRVTTNTSVALHCSMTPLKWGRGRTLFRITPNDSERPGSRRDLWTIHTLKRLAEFATYCSPNPDQSALLIHICARLGRTALFERRGRHVCNSAG
jgi:hypothetical protein